MYISVPVVRAILPTVSAVLVLLMRVVVAPVLGTYWYTVVPESGIAYLAFVDTGRSDVPSTTTYRNSVVGVNRSGRLFSKSNFHRPSSW